MLGDKTSILKQSADFQSAPVAVINIGRSTIFGADNPGNWSVAKKGRRGARIRGFSAVESRRYGHGNRTSRCHFEVLPVDTTIRILRPRSTLGGFDAQY